MGETTHCLAESDTLPLGDGGLPLGLFWRQLARYCFCFVRGKLIKLHVGGLHIDEREPTEVAESEGALHPQLVVWVLLPSFTQFQTRLPELVGFFSPSAHVELGYKKRFPNLLRRPSLFLSSIFWSDVPPAFLPVIASPNLRPEHLFEGGISKQAADVDVACCDCDCVETLGKWVGY